MKYRQNKSPRPQLPASYYGSRKTPAVRKSIAPLCPFHTGPCSLPGSPHPFTALSPLPGILFLSCLSLSGIIANVYSSKKYSPSLPSPPQQKSQACFPSSLPPWAPAAPWTWAAHMDCAFLCLPLDSVLRAGPGSQEGLRQGPEGWPSGELKSQ